MIILNSYTLGPRDNLTHMLRLMPQACSDSKIVLDRFIAAAIIVIIIIHFKIE